MRKCFYVIRSLSFFQAWVANFERPRMNANSLLASPTGLSPYLRFGCLSCRLFYFKLTDLYRKVRHLSSEAAVFFHVGPSTSIEVKLHYYCYYFLF